MVQISPSVMLYNLLIFDLYDKLWLWCFNFWCNHYIEN